ncbi:hypothetical protein AMECASPLE_019518 [Ameca splendens]|uniref:Carboxypeptidase activation peptide domain-containing protein n=1 Tax=Ameca splendens TaxID=208324 RepID=A0ABV1AB27_9TELE
MPCFVFFKGKVYLNKHSFNQYFCTYLHTLDHLDIFSLECDIMTTLWVLFIFLNFDLLLKAGHCTEPGGHVLSITPNTQEQVEILKNVSTQYQTVLWKPVSPHNIKELTQVHLYVPAKSSDTVRNLLQRQNIDHEVMLPNADVIIEMQMRNDSTDPRSGSTFYHRYHTLEDIYDWINRTVHENPNTVKAILVGSSYEKRPLYALKTQGERDIKYARGDSFWGADIFLDHCALNYAISTC